MNDRLLLIGMMGAGKTTVGQAIAQRTGLTYVDNDDLVAQLAGSATADIATHGAEALHAVEQLVVQKILTMEPPLVAGIPGSAVDAAATRDQLRSHGTVVWLRAGTDTLAARVGTGAGRPFLADGEVNEVLSGLYAGRAPAYAAAAHLVIDVDERTPDDIASWILDHLPPEA